MTDQARDERSALLRAAWTVLRRSGFEGFKVQLVLRQSGLSARTFYRHFPDKDALIVALIHDEYAATAGRLTEATRAAGEGPVEQVSAWVRELLLGAADPARAPRTRLFSANYSVMSRFPEISARASRLLVEPLEAAIVRGHASGIFPGPDPAGDAQQVARLGAGAINELLAHRPGATNIDDVILSTTAFALRALRVPETPAP